MVCRLLSEAVPPCHPGTASICMATMSYFDTWLRPLVPNSQNGKPDEPADPEAGALPDAPDDPEGAAEPD
jgi:hypothetical protein